MKRRAFYAGQSGATRPVLFEQHKDAALLSGFTDNYVKIEVPFAEGLLNTIAPLRLGQLGLDGEALVCAHAAA